MASEEMKATEVAALLDLKPHPEGGFYAETFRDGSVTLTTSQLPPHCTYCASAIRLITAQGCVCCTSISRRMR
jgi:hypothetical protein